MSTDEYRRNTDLKKLLCALLIGAICVCALTGCKRKAPAQDASEDDIPVAANAGAEVTPVQKGNAYYVAIPNILAKELGAPHTIAFGEYEITCSALTYAYSVLRAYPESDTSAEAVNLRTLARALVRYQQTAVAYFESK